MKNVIRALICCVLSVTITLVGYGNMPSASAEIHQCNPGGGDIVDIPPNKEVLLCSGEYYQFKGRRLPIHVTVTNTSPLYNANILFSWADETKEIFIPADARDQPEPLIFRARTTVTVVNNSQEAPVLLTIKTCTCKDRCCQVPIP